MHNLKKFIFPFICIIIITSFPTKAIAKDELGWVIINYTMEDGSKYPWDNEIVGSQTIFLPLKNGVALYQPQEPSNARVEIVSITSTNLRIDEKSNKFIVTSANNNAQNAGIITIKCKWREQLIAQVIDKCYDKDGKLIFESGIDTHALKVNQTFIDEPKINYYKEKGYKYSESTVHELAYDGYLGRMIGKFNGKVSIKVKNPNGDKGYYIEHKFVLDQLKQREIFISVTDNAVIDGKVYRLNGADYFDRTLKSYKSDKSGNLHLTVKSPSGGKYKGKQLEFKKIVLSKDGGIVIDALSGKSLKTPPGVGNNPNSFTIDVDTSKDTWYVHCFWDATAIKDELEKPDPDPNPDPKPDGGDKPEVVPPVGGKIIFDPDSTEWTNEDKISEGRGKYDVEVKYVGDNPAIGTAVATWHHYEPVPPSTDSEGHTVSHPPIVYDHYTTFEVRYPLDHIIVSGDANARIRGDSGTAYIEKEGYHLDLDAIGYWGKVEYDKLEAPDQYDSLKKKDIPPAPANPTGHSGNYNLDWTKPEVGFNVEPGIFSTDRNAVRKTSIKGKDFAYYGDLTFHDNLSGMFTVKYGWSYGSSDSGVDYETLYTSPITTTNRKDERFKEEIEKPVGDDVYLHVRLRDIAGNDTYEKFGPFEDPIKLRDFQISDIRDPIWDEVFWKDKDFLSPTGITFKVPQLPVDENSHPYLDNVIPKKGYSFYFDITSEFLYRDKDKIVIIPSFYYWDESQNKRVKADCYYNINNNPFIKVGSTQDKSSLSLSTVDIGSLSKITLTKGLRVVKGREWIEWKKEKPQYVDGKIQWWYGKYFIPSTSIFVPEGVEPRPENVLNNNKVIINFDIKAYKNGVETNSSSQIFDYAKVQWKEEKGPKDNKYKIGDVIVYDNKYSTLSDFKTYIIQ